MSWSSDGVSLPGQALNDRLLDWWWIGAIDDDVCWRLDAGLSQPGEVPPWPAIGAAASLALGLITSQPRQPTSGKAPWFKFTCFRWIGSLRTLPNWQPGSSPVARVHEGTNEDVAW